MPSVYYSGLSRCCWSPARTPPSSKVPGTFWTVPTHSCRVLPGPHNMGPPESRAESISASSTTRRERRRASTELPHPAHFPTGPRCRHHLGTHFHWLPFLPRLTSLLSCHICWGHFPKNDLWSNPLSRSISGKIQNLPTCLSDSRCIVFINNFHFPILNFSLPALSCLWLHSASQGMSLTVEAWTQRTKYVTQPSSALSTHT